jgi:hypothetical protein
MFIGSAAIVVGIFAFSYTKPGRKIFRPEYDDDE